MMKNEKEKILHFYTRKKKNYKFVCVYFPIDFSGNIFKKERGIIKPERLESQWGENKYNVLKKRTAAIIL